MGSMLYFQFTGFAQTCKSFLRALRFPCSYPFSPPKTVALSCRINSRAFPRPDVPSQFLGIIANFLLTNAPICGIIMS